jgi:hypothetical protein
LRHNHVPWSLGPSRTKQVSESAAWSATAAAGSAEVADDKSAAAGRHAERSATDTSASTNTTPPPTTTAAGSASGSAAPDVGGLIGSGGDDTGGLGGLGTKGAGPGGGGAGDGTIGLGTIGTIGHGAGRGDGQGFGAGQGRLGGAHVAAAPQVKLDIATEGNLPKEIARRIVRQNLGRFRLCYENALRDDPTAKGRIVVRFVVGADGQVVSSVVDSSTMSDAVGGCVSRGMTSLQFPSFEGITKVIATVTFAPA